MVQDSSEGVTRIRRCRFEMKTPDRYTIGRLHDFNHTYLIFGYTQYKTSDSFTTASKKYF